MKLGRILFAFLVGPFLWADATFAQTLSPVAEQLVIYAAEADLATGTLTVTGRDFGKGETFGGTVRLFVPGQGLLGLTVQSFEETTQTVDELIMFAKCATEAVEDKERAKQYLVQAKDFGTTSAELVNLAFSK